MLNVKGVLMNWISDWPAQAACRGVDPDLLFVQGAAQNRVKSMCAGCNVRTECLADALDNEIEFGVWGGMTERERRALLRKRPDVVSWRKLLETARSSHEVGARFDTPVVVSTDRSMESAGLGVSVKEHKVPTQQVAPAEVVSVDIRDRELATYSESSIAS